MGKDLKGKNLGKGLSQRADGRYEARAIVNGKKIDIYSKSLSELKKTFANAKLLALQAESDTRSCLSVREWYEEWFTKCKAPQLKSIQSAKTYDRKIRNTYIAILGAKRMVEVTQLDIQNATNELCESKKYSIRGVKEALHALRDCFDVAIANKIIPSNPVVGIAFKNENSASKERRVLEHWEQDLFIEEVEGTYYYEPYMILLLTGMRIGEFSGLQWRDIDFTKKRIHIARAMMTAYIDGKKIMELSTPKTFNSYRDIPFFGDVEKYFKDWKEKQYIYRKKLGSRWRTDESLGDLVFTTTMGSPITRYNIVHDLKRVEDNIRLKEANRAFIEGREPRYFEHIHPHAFRHTFATRCFEKGLDPLVVQSIMGHSNYSTTISYTHILENKIDEAADKAGLLLA